MEAVFAFETPPAGLTIKPMRGCVRVGTSVEVTVEITSMSSMNIEADLKAAIRCGKPIKVGVKAEAIAPDVEVLEEELDFGGVVVGARSSLPLTLHNRSAVPALMHVDLSDYPEFTLGTSDGDDLASKAGSEEEMPVSLCPAAAEEGHRLFLVKLAPQSTLPISVGFSPQSTDEFAFELPLNPAGLEPTAPMRRAVAGEGLKPRLKLSETVRRSGCTWRRVVDRANGAYGSMAHPKLLDEELP